MTGQKRPASLSDDEKLNFERLVAECIRDKRGNERFSFRKVPFHFTFRKNTEVQLFFGSKLEVNSFN